MRRAFLLTVGLLCLLLQVEAITVTFQATGIPEGWGEMKAWANNTRIQSGADVALGAKLTFTVPSGPARSIEWYVNDKRYQTSGFSLVATAVTDIHVEARYREPYKVIFAGTPYVKYADAGGMVTLTQNYYHHDYVVEKGTTHTVDYWTGDNGKTYPVDNDLTDNKWTREVLTADVVLTPHYVLSSKDVGDGSATVTWQFDRPDSVVTFQQMKSKAPFVQPTVFQESGYTDVVMTIDATQGLIDNHNDGNWVRGSNPAKVGAGTRFRLPALYGSTFEVLTAKEPLSATTIAGSTDYEQTVEPNGLFKATLHYYAMEDSIDIVAEEELQLISIAASYPGGSMELVWEPHVRRAETVIGTTRKSGAAGSLLYDLTDITNNGLLHVIPSAVDSMTSLIEIPAAYNKERYMSVGFQVAEGYAFQPQSAVVPVMPVTAAQNITTVLVLEDETGNKIDSLLTRQQPNVVNNDSLVYNAPTEQSAATFLEGLVTLKVYVYGAAANYRLGRTLTIAGQLYQRIAFPENGTWMPFLVTSGIDFDGPDLRSVETYEVVGVRERQCLVTKIPVEECPPGTIILMHAPEAGAVYYVPLTRCDDAFDPSLNLLKVSDGTVTGDATRYVFSTQDGKPAFVRTTAGEPIAKGDFYLEYDFITSPEALYVNAADVPAGIVTVDDDNLLTTGTTRRVVKNGRVYIIKPDGSVYNMAGVRIDR